MGRTRRGGGQGALSLLSFQDIITSLSGIMILLVLLLALDISPEQTPSAPPEKKIPEKTSIEKNLAVFLEEIASQIDDLDPTNSFDIAKIKIQLEDIRAEQDNQKQKLMAQIEELKNKKTAAVQTKKQIDAAIQDLRNGLADIKNNKTHAKGKKGLGTNYTSGTIGYRPMLAECSGRVIRAGFWDSQQASDIFSTDNAGQRSFIRFVNRLNKRKEYVVFFIKPSAGDYIMKLINTVRGVGIHVGYEPIVEDDWVGNFGKP